MQLTILADAISIRQIVGPIDRKVESIAYDSRRVQRNGMFVALRGEKTDGHNFIGQAIEKGASVIVTEREEEDSRATFLVVEDTRSALTGLAATFYRRPADRHTRHNGLRSHRPAQVNGLPLSMTRAGCSARTGRSCRGRTSP